MDWIELDWVSTIRTNVPTLI